MHLHSKTIIKCAFTFHYLSNYPLPCNLHLPSVYCPLILHLLKTLTSPLQIGKNLCLAKSLSKTLTNLHSLPTHTKFQTCSNGFHITQTYLQEIPRIICRISTHLRCIACSTGSYRILQQRYRQKRSCTITCFLQTYRRTHAPRRNHGSATASRHCQLLGMKC